LEKDGIDLLTGKRQGAVITRIYILGGSGNGVSKDIDWEDAGERGKLRTGGARVAAHRLLIGPNYLS